MTFYRRKLPRLQRHAKPHFVTFVTKNRRILEDHARDIVLACRRHDHETKCNPRVAVVMTDHAHIIFTPLIGEPGQSRHLHSRNHESH
jgi:REP element-mobilizing transposase RayT